MMEATSLMMDRKIVRDRVKNFNDVVPCAAVGWMCRVGPERREMNLEENTLNL